MSKVPYTGDALFAPCPEGGDMQFDNGEPLRGGGLSNAVYISIAGGNDLDDGLPNSRLQYWGNFIETDEARHVRSRTLTLARQLPLVSANLLRIENAVLEDTAWLISTGAATEITAVASIEHPRKLCLTITVNTFNDTKVFKFRPNWEAAEFEPAQLECAS